MSWALVFMDFWEIFLIMIINVMLRELCKEVLCRCGFCLKGK